MNLFLQDLQINYCFLFAVKPFFTTLFELQLGQILLSLSLIHKVSFFIILFDLKNYITRKGAQYCTPFYYLFIIFY